MSAVARSTSRIFSIISKRNRRFSSSVTTEPPKEPIISSSSLLKDQPPPAQNTPPEGSGAEKKPWSFLKYSVIAAITGGVATAGYATYAYTTDEIEDKTKSLRESAKYAVGDDASAFDKFQALVYSSAMTVPAKLVEFYIELRRLTEDQVKGFREPTSDKLLPDLHPLEQHVFTLVLDLSETLIYSDWKRDRGWRTFKRPGVDAFLEHLAQYFEIVVYSDQLNMYVDPVIERLDPKHCIRFRLSRGDTRYIDGKHYRDLSKLNRDPSRIIYLSGHALESSLQPENCVEIKPWKGETDDTVLLDLIPFLEYVAKHRPADIRTVLASYQGRDIAKEFIERSKEHQRSNPMLYLLVLTGYSIALQILYTRDLGWRVQEQKQHGRLWRR
ncbi:mitochondrial import inner membrane translocase subunit TIM50 [Capsicum chacoense]